MAKIFRISVRDAMNVNNRVVLGKVYTDKKEAVQACESIHRWVEDSCPMVVEYNYKKG